MFTKKAITPIVATAFLLVIVVVTIISFQNWYQTYSTTISNKLEQTIIKR